MKWLASLLGTVAGPLAGGWAGILGRLLMWLLILALGLLPFYGCYRWGAHNTRLTYEAALSALNAAAATTRTNAVIKARQEERDAAQASIAATEARMNAEREENDALQADLTSLRGGNLKLRNRLAASRCSADDVRADAANPGRPAAARTAGLLATDAEFLLRIGREADAVARKLTEAQQQLRVCMTLNHAPAAAP